MPVRVLTREQVRQVDRVAIEQFGLPGIVLMENAGRGCAELLLATGGSGPVCICCGKGNNAGDGFVIARHLANRGISVDVVLFSDPGGLGGDAAITYRILDRTVAAVPVEAGRPRPGDEQLRLHRLEIPEQLDALRRILSGAEWIVDALLGTGTTGAVREPYGTVINAVNQSDKPILAVDLPSGLDCDTGESLGPCVQARLTATFVARKPGFDQPSVAPCLGEIHVIDIGIPRAVLTRVLQR